MSAILPPDFASYELHREGIGLLPARGAGQDGSAIWVKVDGSSRPLRSCTCKGSKKKGTTCEHLKQLGEGSRLFVERFAANWQPIFERSLWFRLAKSIYAGSQLPCEAVSVQQVERLDTGSPAIRVLDASGFEQLQYLDTSPARLAFLERTGKAPRSEDYVDRAGLLERLSIFQLSATERLMEKKGMRSRGRAFEGSFWYRLAYHAVRTWGDAAWEGDERLAEAGEEGVGTFHPAVDKKNGAFTITHRLGPERATLKISLPRSRVQATLELLRGQFPDQPDLQIHPVPLQSLFKVSQETELDLEVRPMLRMLQASGEDRFYSAQDFEKFRYGDLYFLKDLGVLAQLPKEKDQAKTFRAPPRMRLARSQVPAFLDDHVDALEDGSLVLDAPLQGLKIWKTYDRVEVSGEAEAGAPRGGRSYRLSVRYGFGDRSISLAELLRARRAKQPYYETADGWVDLQAPAFAELARLEERQLPPGEAAEDGEGEDEIYLSAGELIRFQAAAEQPLEVGGPEDRGALLRRLLDQRPPAPWAPPPGFQSTLRDYQVNGVDWLSFLAEQGLGGLLCDDMGLGKTHQAMALMASRAAAENGEAQSVAGPCLVVCPTSVMSHWRDKLRRFAPELRIHLYHGPERHLKKKLGRGDVIVTSYGVLRNDIQKLEARPLSMAVFDEIQYLKNRGTVSYEAARRLAVPVKIGLTGTPIENSLAELKALFDLVLPGYLGSDADFHERFDRALVETGAGLRENRARLEQLRRLISPFVLRRLKASVLDELPAKIEDVRTCELSDEQVALYRQTLETRARPLVKRLRSEDGSPVPYLHIFAVLNLLKQICDHPALVAGELDRADRYRSGKWDLFTEILRECLDAGLKVVVFSQYLGMLELMDRYLEKEGVDHARLQGSTAAEERGRLVERFNTDPDCRVFLASLKAGGTGIDLVGGSVVIHYDRWWNAAREDQATDRVHRLGQKRAVQVFKLVTEGTLEERIAGIIESKRDLLDNVVQEDDAKLAKIFDRRQLLELLQEI